MVYCQLYSVHGHAGSWTFIEMQVHEKRQKLGHTEKIDVSVSAPYFRFKVFNFKKRFTWGQAQNEVAKKLGIINMPHQWLFISSLQ